MTAIEWLRRHAALPLNLPERRKQRDAGREVAPPRFESQRLIGALATLVVLSIAGIVILALLLLPFQYRQARRRWEQQGIRHYQMDITWASGWSYGYVRVEMRDNQLVKAVDLDTGQPADQSKLLSARYYGSIDHLFGIIDARMQPEWAWRNLLERYVPWVARRIDSCVAPLSDVGYDQRFGFPTGISYNDGWCTITFFDYSNVKIAGFQPLP